MNRSKLSRLIYGFCFSACVIALAVLTGCVPPPAVTQPTLSEARAGQQPQAGDLTLAPGEVQGEVTDVDPATHEIHVRTDDGRMAAIVYDPAYTRVTYHARDYSVADLQPGDLVAFHTVPPGGRYIDMIRVQEPVQARASGPAYVQRPLPPRSEVVEGTVVRINYDLGVFDVRPRNGGPIVTVSVPYNATARDVESFRTLRRGDYVRLEGQYYNPDSFQLLAFLYGSDIPLRR